MKMNQNFMDPTMSGIMPLRMQYQVQKAAAFSKGIMHVIAMLDQNGDEVNCISLPENTSCSICLQSGEVVVSKLPGLGRATMLWTHIQMMPFTFPS